MHENPGGSKQKSHQRSWFSWIFAWIYRKTGKIQKAYVRMDEICLFRYKESESLDCTGRYIITGEEELSR